MDQRQKAILAWTKEHVQTLFAQEPSGHGMDHLQRVVSMSQHLAHKEGVDVFLCSMTAWLHDVTDDKLQLGDGETLNQLLAHPLLHEDEQKAIRQALAGQSYRRQLKDPDLVLSDVARVVRDADFLDASGALGIARTFMYAGAHGRGIQETLEHVRCKLLTLQDLMVTQAGKQFAQRRHAFLLAYMKEMDVELKEVS